MKKIYFVLSVIFFAQFICAQNPVPNPSFENWTGNKPTSWTNSTDVSQVTPGHTGSYAVQGLKSSTLYPNLSLNATAISQKYDFINLYYKFTQVSTEYIVISVVIKDAGNVQIGSTAAYITMPSTTFQAFTYPIYYTGNNPATVVINITLNNGGPVPPAGSAFIVDDISLSNSPLSINEGMGNTTANIFWVAPNPAAEKIKIGLQQNEMATIRLLNLAGQEVKTTTAEGETEIDVCDLPAGHYLVAVLQSETVRCKRIEIVR